MKTLIDEILKEAAEIKDKLYKQVLSNHLGREAQEDDFRQCSIGVVQGTSDEIFSHQNKRIGRVIMSIENLRVKYTFIPEYNWGEPS